MCVAMDERLATHEQFHIAPMAWVSGIVVAVKKSSSSSLLKERKASNGGMGRLNRGFLAFLRRKG
jgi:hypothetical protein